MKKLFFTFILFVVIASLTTTTKARNVYVKLYADEFAWSDIQQDPDNVVIILPEGSTDFVGDVLPQLLPDDVVWVAKGEYINSSKLTLQSKDGLNYGNIKIYGGFMGDETLAIERAKEDLDGNGFVESWEFSNETNFKGVGNVQANATNWQLIQIDNNSFIDGITLSDHYFNGNQAAGGVVELSATIKNCIIRDVTAEGSGTVNGGGLYVTGGQVESCLFESCVATGSGTSFGGGLLIFGIKDNTAGEPTGYIKNSMIRNCASTTSGNTARAGGVFGKGGVTIENCVIYNNYAKSNGGAFYFHNNGDGNKHVNRVIGTTIANNQSDANPLFPECYFLEIYNTISWGNARNDNTYVNAFRQKSGNSSSTAYPYMDGFAYHGTMQDYQNKNSSMTPIIVTGAINDSSEDSNNPSFVRPTTFHGIATTNEKLDEIRKANWFILKDSPLINAGVDSPTNQLGGYDQASLLITFSSNDINGTQRNNTDIGAYEYEKGIYSSLERESTAEYKIHVIDNKIMIKNLTEQAEVSLYSINGVKLFNTVSSQEYISIPISNKGVYIVLISENNQKVTKKIII